MATNPSLGGGTSLARQPDSKQSDPGNYYGQGVDAETGTLLGTFYSSGTTVIRGSITVESGKVFILDGSSGAFVGTGQSGIASAVSSRR